MQVLDVGQTAIETKLYNSGLTALCLYASQGGMQMQECLTS